MIFLVNLKTFLGKFEDFGRGSILELQGKLLAYWRAAVALQRPILNFAPRA
jgi:hypothetical protein